MNKGMTVLASVAVVTGIMTPTVAKFYGWIVIYQRTINNRKCAKLL